ncbi:MAG: DNA polymerase III subunit beta [Planctomycetia bacterium]|nr:DNA polymerase III subunit beta [Planctomycetia bacterium]
MKFSCNRESFSRLFFLAASVASVRDIKAILQNVKIVLQNDKLILLATDNDMSIRLELSENINIQEPGEAILPTILFRKILQESFDKELTIESNSEQTIVSGERSCYQLPTQSASEFPEILPFNAQSYYSVSSSILKQIIRRTCFAIETESSRYSLSGVLIELKENSVIAVATDGRRLACQEGTADFIHTEDESLETNSIFPVRTLNLIEKSINEAEKVDIAIDNNCVSLKIGSTVIHSRLQEGHFPRWRGIIPSEDNKSKVDIIAGQLLSGVRQAEVVTIDKEPGVNFKFSDGILVIFASGAESGESRIEIPIAFSSEPIQIRMNARFIIDFLRELEAEKIISIYFNENSPILFKTDDQYSYVVMPLNL